MSRRPWSRGMERILRRRNRLQIILLSGLVLSLAGTLPAQGTPDKTNKTLVVNGKTVGSELLQINGHSYVDVETLAQITNGAVTVEPTRIVLTIPISNSAAVPSAVPPQTAPGLSRDFASAAVAELAEMREWRGAIGTMVTYGLAVSGSWSQDYHNRVEAGLAQAALAASTDADQNALPLLRGEFDNLTAWANEVQAARQALNGAKTVDPNALRNDPSLAKITDCGRFLNGMVVSGTFADNASCH
jgi:hypothetical protein